jgi:tRNA threonylcarbamoyladenosine biosynthesis protein TsaB
VIILAIRTDKPEAELAIYENSQKLAEFQWQAHRQLAETIHTKLEGILNKSSISLSDLEGIVFYEGPGSFTGLRIGASVANALAYAQEIPIIAKGGEGWIKTGIADLQKGKSDKVAIPKYGAPAATTQPRK